MKKTSKLYVCTHFLKDGKTQQEELEILRGSTSGGMK